MNEVALDVLFKMNRVYLAYNQGDPRELHREININISKIYKSSVPSEK
jgi:hypothetical protein